MTIKEIEQEHINTMYDYMVETLEIERYCSNTVLSIVKKLSNDELENFIRNRVDKEEAFFVSSPLFNQEEDFIFLPVSEIEVPAEEIEESEMDEYYITGEYGYLNVGYGIYFPVKLRVKDFYDNFMEDIPSIIDMDRDEI